MLFGHLEVGGVNRAREVREYASGKAVNVARVVRALGDDAVFVGPVGGMRGRCVMDDLKAAGIESDLVESDAETRQCITVVDVSGGTATELIEEHNAISPALGAAILQRLEFHLPRAPVVTMSGSLAPGIAHDYYAHAVRLARAAGVHTVLDASGEPLRRALAERPTVVKLNRAELEATVASALAEPDRPLAAMRSLVREGASWVVMTDGIKGSYATNGEAAWHISTPPVISVSAIGSGDAYSAGLAVGILRGLAISGCFRLASACAAANAATPQAGHLEPGLIPALHERVLVRRLDRSRARPSATWQPE